MRQHVEEEPATLFVVGSYHIGKERAYIGPARALGWRIYCPPAKLRVSYVLAKTSRCRTHAQVAYCHHVHGYLLTYHGVPGGLKSIIKRRPVLAH